MERYKVKMCEQTWENELLFCWLEETLKMLPVCHVPISLHICTQSKLANEFSIFLECCVYKSFGLRCCPWKPSKHLWFSIVSLRIKTIVGLAGEMAWPPTKD